MEVARRINPKELSRPHSRRFILKPGNVIIVDNEFLLRLISTSNGKALADLVTRRCNEILIGENLHRLQRAVHSTQVRSSINNRPISFQKIKNSLPVFVADKHRICCSHSDSDIAIIRVDSTNQMDITFYEESPGDIDALKDFFAQHTE